MHIIIWHSWIVLILIGNFGCFYFNCGIVGQNKIAILLESFVSLVYSIKTSINFWKLSSHICETNL